MRSNPYFITAATQASAAITATELATSAIIP
ncbi:hypothetical protein D043_1828A, partial [Vibrio parahaemolyticus EKP-021]